jgi:succinyl-diaminopimelate desuccinylase
MKEKLFSWIDGSLELAANLQTGLTKYPAVSPDAGGEGELDKCIFLQDWLKEHGITQLERYDAPDERAKGKIRPNLIATIPGADDGENSPRLWIMSHIDVVPAGEKDLWDSDPWTLKRVGHYIYGRGVEDDQQGIVSSVLAALAFTKQGLKPARTIKLLFGADEETGSAYGIGWLVKNHGNLFRKNDMALVPDGGCRDGSSIEIAEKNILWAQFTTNGVQAHGSRPDMGKNAALAGSDLALRLHYDLSKEFSALDSLFNPDYSTFQPTKREANVPNVNTIPDKDVFCMDMRILPQFTTSMVTAKIDSIRKEVEDKYGVKIDYTLLQKMESKATSVDAPIVKELTKAITEVYPVKPHAIGIGGGTMAAFLRNEGIDCAVWTKTLGTLHQPNECADLNDILSDAKVMALLAL